MTYQIPYNEAPQPASRALKKSLYMLMFPLILGAICLVPIIQAWAAQSADAHTHRPAKPSWLAQYYGPFTSPDDAIVIHQYVADPGALGWASMWLYREHGPGDFELIFRGLQAPSRNEPDFQWVGDEVLEIHSIQQSGRPYTTRIQFRYMAKPRRDVAEK